MAEPWRDTDYDYRKEVTIQDANVDGDLTDFPCLVRWVDDTDLNTTDSKVQSDLDDIRFYDGSGNLLKHEVEWYEIDGTDSSANVWVKKPTLYASPSGSDNKVWLYYGYASASNGEDASNVWDSDFVGVWHLVEEGDGTADEFADSTGNGYHAKGWNSAADPARVSGPAKYAQDLRYGQGGNSYSGAILFDDMTADFGETGTFEVFIRQETDPPSTDDDGLLSQGGGYGFGTSGSYTLYPYSNGTIYLDIFRNDRLTTGEGDIADMTEWHHLAVTNESGAGNYKAYQNGSTFYTGSGEASITMGTSPALGYPDSSTNQHFEGYVTEFRLSNTVRSAAWLKFESANYLEADNELTFGAEEEQSAAGGAPRAYEYYYRHLLAGSI